MTWTKLDDGYTEHPKIVAAGPLAAWLHTCALVYCGRNLTDGFIHKNQVARLVDWEGIYEGTNSVTARQLSKTLLDCGLWEPVPRGYQIHDYLSYNPSKEQVLAEREATRKRVELWRNRQRGNIESNADGNAVSTPSPVPVPVPDPNPVPGPIRRGFGDRPKPTADGRSGPPADLPPDGFPVAGSPDGYWIPDETFLQGLEASYPSIPIQAELRAARSWILCNPTRRKTARGMPRFLNAWMARAQNGGSGRNGHQQEDRKASRHPSYASFEQLYREGYFSDEPEGTDCGADLEPGPTLPEPEDQP